MWTLLPLQRHRFLLPGCECCDEPVGCGLCPAAPAQWELSVSGISNATCANCDGWNGHWVLTNDSLVFPGGNPCRWSSPVESGPGPCAIGCGNCSRWQLALSAASADLVADGNIMATYSLPFEDFDCLGPNTLPYISDSLWCTDWPSNLTITPA